MRSARKHLAWVVQALPGGEAFRQRINTIDDCTTQVRALTDYLDELADQHPLWPERAEPDGASTRPQEGANAKAANEDQRTGRSWLAAA